MCICIFAHIFIFIFVFIFIFIFDRYELIDHGPLIRTSGLRMFE